MSMDIKDLEASDQANPDLMLSEVLESREQQYQDASLEEILDLLEEAAETFCCMATKLPPRLRNIAKKEIEFLMALYQKLSIKYRKIQNPQPLQNIRQLLSSCAI